LTEAPRFRDLATPISALSGLDWPAIPDQNGNIILSLLFQLEQSQWWGLSAAETRGLKQLFLARLGHPFELEFTFHDEIERGAGASFSDQPNRRTTMKTVFENSSGSKYAIVIDNEDGSGTGKLFMRAVGNDATFGNETQATIPLSVDAAKCGKWRGYHLSRKIHAAAYNGGQTLDAILNAS